MIEIKNKRMLLFPEDRIIGAQGDMMSAERKFVLDRVQGGYDLSDMICWVKVEHKTGNVFDQMLKKEVQGEKIILTWILSAPCLEKEGELSAQIIFVDKGYFKQSDLDSLDDGDFVVPLKISGVSAPVWQSHKETFVVSESISDTQPYTETTKNVLLTALADAQNYSQKAMQYSSNTKADALATQMLLNEANEVKNECLSYYENAKSEAILAEASRQSAAGFAESASINRDECFQFVQNAKNFSEMSEIYSLHSYTYSRDAVEGMGKVFEAEERMGVLNADTAAHAQAAESYAISAMETESSIQAQKSEIDKACEDANGFSQQAEIASANCTQILGKLKKQRDYRLIYSKTLAEDEDGCISFEINQDLDGNPLNLSECVFYIYCPKTAGAGGSYVKLEGLSEGNANFTKLAQFSLINTNNDVYCRAECQNRGRWIVKTAKGSAWDQNAESVTAQGAVCSQSRANDGKPLTAVRLVQHSSVGVPFASGMSLEVWGVDSIKEGA